MLVDDVALYDMDVEINDEAGHTLSFIKEAETAPEVLVNTKDNINNEGDAKGTNSVEETREDPHVRVEVDQVPPTPPPRVTMKIVTWMVSIIRMVVRIVNVVLS